MTLESIFKSMVVLTILTKSEHFEKNSNRRVQEIQYCVLKTSGSSCSLVSIFHQRSSGIILKKGNRKLPQATIWCAKGV